ncbi:hypothetical protein [Saccharococcus sp. Marseille-Q5394]|uniref:hypothetical protein n=1 Tax=Saccharococcus sp. Marseille-Q5394 TaxID=2972778 RepID=UPI0021C997A9|nr:hypothetical protein [Saccharococcus sp. Marseille-Q5394]
MTLFKEMDGYIKLEQDIKQRFKDAEKRNAAEKESLEIQLQELQKEARELYMMMVLGEITKETYEDFQATVKQKEADLSRVNKMLADIADLQREEIAEKVYQPMKEKHKELQSFVNQIKRDERKRILQAKAEYIDVIIDAKKNIGQGVSYDSFMQRMAVEQGDKTANYAYTFDGYAFITTNEFDGTAGADMSVEELREIYESGELPRRLKRELAK